MANKDIINKDAAKNAVEQTAKTIKNGADAAFDSLENAVEQTESTAMNTVDKTEKAINNSLDNQK